MKKGFYIVIFILLHSSIYSQNNQLGVRIQGVYAYNTSGLGFGAGLHYAYHINPTSTLRLLIEGNYIRMPDGSSKRSPLVSALDYESYQFQLQYLYFFPGKEYYIGAGIGKFNYHLNGDHSSRFHETYYARDQEIGNTFGFDILVGATLSKLLSAEINYIFSYPELSSTVKRFDINENFFTITETVNMSSIYLNIIFSINTIDL